MEERSGLARVAPFDFTERMRRLPAVRRRARSTIVLSGEVGPTRPV